MRPKGKLFALFAIFAAIGLVTATGAFTTVEAQRTMTVNTAADSAALLQMEPSTFENGAYAESDGGSPSQLAIDISTSNDNQGSEFAGDGINANAITRMDRVFNITNQGTQEVRVWIDHDTGDGLVFYNGTDHTDPIQTTSTDGVDLGPGETLMVGIELDLLNDNPSFSSDVTITVHADADLVGT